MRDALGCGDLGARNYTLSVLGGDTWTGSGSPTACPNVEKRKGKATEEFVLGVQVSSPEIVEYLPGRTCPDAPPPGTWFPHLLPGRR